MSRLRAWTWKEAREHRWALVGVWLAVALVTALPFVAFREETTRAHLDRLPAVAIALATLVLGLDLFAWEPRRSTHALILRTPGAAGWAFPAKMLLFAAGTMGALAVEELLRHPLEAMTGVPRPYVYSFEGGEWRRIDRPIRPEWAFGLPIRLYAGLLAAAVGSWHVAGSVVSPRAGVGALCGVMALSILSVPLVLLYAQHPWWFRPSGPETSAWIAGIGLAGLLVTDRAVQVGGERTLTAVTVGASRATAKAQTPLRDRAHHGGMADHGAELPVPPARHDASPGLQHDRRGTGPPAGATRRPRAAIPVRRWMLRLLRRRGEVLRREGPGFRTGARGAVRLARRGWGVGRP